MAACGRNYNENKTSHAFSNVPPLCVWVCVCASVLKGQSSLSAAQNFFYYLQTFICFRLDFASCSSSCLRMNVPGGLTRFCLVTESFVGNWKYVYQTRRWAEKQTPLEISPNVWGRFSTYLYINIKQGMASHLFFWEDKKIISILRKWAHISPLVW